jgi:hypothetical protein
VKNPSKYFFGLTWLGWLNMLLLQLLGLRLAYGDRWRLIYGVLPLVGWFGKWGLKHYQSACRKRKLGRK